MSADPLFDQIRIEAEERANYFPRLAASTKRVYVDLYGKNKTLTGPELASRIRDFATSLENSGITKVGIQMHSGKLYAYELSLD